jgi:hypothetical protein
MAVFNLNTKVSIFAIHPHKVLIFFQFNQYYPKIFILPIFFLFFINKEINLSVQKWPDGQRGGYSHLDFFKKNFIKKLKIMGNMRSF